MNMEKIIGLRNDKTVYKDGKKVIKFFNDNYTKAQVLNEALNQARVEETTLLVPELLSVTHLEGNWLMMYEYIDGKTLEQVMLSDSENIDIYLEKFVDLQIQVHSIHHLLLNKQKDRLIEKIEKTDLLATTRCELQNKLESMNAHKKLCHGDFNPSNIIINHKNEYYIIDWAHASVGSASADSATTYLEFLMNYNQLTADKYIDLYCEKSNTLKTYVKSWLPIVAAARLTKANKNEKNNLMKIINSRNNL